MDPYLASVLHHAHLVLDPVNKQDSVSFCRLREIPVRGYLHELSVETDFFPNLGSSMLLIARMQESDTYPRSSLLVLFHLSHQLHLDVSVLLSNK